MDGPCTSKHIDEWVKVVHVFDGDTVKLADGRRVRLLGINTPEIGRDGKPSQPFAEEARLSLKKLLSHESRIGLQYSLEQQDRYGRTLAHLFLPNGVNVQQHLLQSGVASTLVVPPNTWGERCYTRTEARTRQSGKGIWSLPSYQPIAAKAIPAQARGFRLIRGRVQRIGEGHRNLWLNLAQQVALRIEKKDLNHFTEYEPRQLKGKLVEARGWLKRRQGELRMRIRHPAALTLIEK